MRKTGLTLISIFIISIIVAPSGVVKPPDHLAIDFKMVEADIRLNFDGKPGQEEVMKKWMSGIKGAAYVLGADMIGVIDRYLGRKSAVEVASDYRSLLMTYNRAARIAREKGLDLFIFNEELARKLIL